MNTLVIGAGAIGIALSTTLLSGGANVSILARGKTLRAIESKGICRTGLFGDISVSPAKLDYVNDSLVYFPNNYYDYILICSKTLANDEISKTLSANRSILKPTGRIMILQNGWENEKPYLRFFSKQQVCSARVITGFQRTEPNISQVTVHSAPVLLGNLFGIDIEKLSDLANVINDGGIPCEVSTGISKAMWAKMLYNCALNPLGAIIGVHYGALGDCPESREIISETIDEVFAVMTAAGYSSFWDSAENYKKEFFSKLLPSTYNHYSSTLQDISKQQKTEIDTLTGKVINLGMEFGVSTPVNTMLYRLIKSKEANYN